MIKVYLTFMVVLLSPTIGVLGVRNPIHGKINGIISEYELGTRV